MIELLSKDYRQEQTENMFHQPCPTSSTHNQNDEVESLVQQQSTAYESF
jgi:hypothetical protein